MSNFKFATRKEAPKNIPHPGMREFVRSLSDENLSWLVSRLEQRFPGDLPDALSFMQKNDEANRFLGNANCSREFFETLDTLTSLLWAENRRRNNKG